MRWLPALALVVLPVPAIAAPAKADIAAKLHTLLAYDARLQSIGWKLARANAPFCADTRPAVGLLILDARNFAQPDAIRDALGLTGEIAIDAVAHDSPAAAAGLKSGEEVIAIGSEAMTALPQVPPMDYTRIAALHERLLARLRERGSVEIELGTAGHIRKVTIAAQNTCVGQFRLSSGGSAAGASGEQVRVSETALAALADDGEAAMIVAHEFAHVILRHSARLGAAHRTARAIRATEAEADQLAPWLMANAGYDPAAAIRFAEQRSRRLLDTFLPHATHGSWKTRATLIRSEVAAIAAMRAVAPGALLDWRSRFLPDQGEARPGR